MAIQNIFLGTITGDKTGDGAKTAGQKINYNFGYLEAKIDDLETSEYDNLFTYTTGAQTFTVPSTLKIMNITLNDGRILKKTIDWTRTSPTEITVIYALETNDTIYITGLN